MERTSLDANYCPHCGTPVKQAIAVATDEPLIAGQSADTVFENQDGHLVLTGNDIRLYIHDN